MELAEFREKYQMLAHLKDVFPTVFTLILSVTITPNILDYIQKSWKLSLPSRIYRLSLDRQNLEYMVYSIRKLGFQNLAFLVLKDSQISGIPKTMVFVDKIENAIELKRYLQSRLPDCIQNRDPAFVIIQSITSNLDANIKTKIIKDDQYKNARICICTKCTGMGINISDIICAIQFNISDFIFLLELF